METNIDDCSGEMLGFVMEQLLDKGALDVFFTSIFMKKNRPAYKICILCKEEDLQKLINLLILETSTFGVRYHKLERTVIDRKFERINTKYGDIQIKLGYLNNKLIKATPEYEDCKIMAKRENIPLVKVFQEINYLIAEKFF